MNDPKQRQRLGMGQPIGRRDFLNGLAVSLGGSYDLLASLATAQEQNLSPISPTTAGCSGAAPPSRSGLGGNYPARIAEFDLIAQGKYESLPAATPIDEEYD